MNKPVWEQIERLYYAALDRTPAERSEFLRNESAGDAELFHEVESLLSSSEAADGFLATPEFDLGLAILAKPDYVLRSGQDFGHYKVLDFIGRGGMGEVYLAEDARLGRKVALKVLPADVAADQEPIRRFIQEARAASALNHPNILTIHEIGETDGWRFIASEFVDGINLRAYLVGTESLSLATIVDIGVQIATALNAAHKVGIVHRDIKPENVVLREDGLVKVLDFGLAKLIKAADHEKPISGFASTTPGIVMGTVAYMSPEQTRGKKTDERSDVWSLGVVLYEMLAGRLPFEGETSSDIIAAILTSEPAPPERERMWIPEGLKQIIAKALCKDPARRHASAKEMADELRSVATDESVVPTARFRATNFDLIDPTDLQFNSTAEALRGSRSESDPGNGHRNRSDSTERLSLSVHRAAKPLIGVVAALAILVGGFFGYRYFSTTSNQIDSIAVLPFENGSGDPNMDFLSDGLSESLIDKLSQLPQLKVAARTSSFRFRGPDIDLQELARKLGVRAVIMGKVMKRGDELTVRVEIIDAVDNVHLWGEQYNRGTADAISIQQDIAQAVTEKLRPKLTGSEGPEFAKSGTRNPQAYQLMLKGRHFDRRGRNEDDRKAANYFEQALAADPNYALAAAHLATTYRGLAQLGDNPDISFQRAEDLARRALELDPDLAEAHYALAGVYRDTWRFPQAEAEYKRALALNPGLAAARGSYATFLTFMKRFDEAIAEATRSLNLDPLSPNSHDSLCRVYYYARRYQDLNATVEKWAEFDRDNPRLNGWRALAFEDNEQFDQALAEFQEAFRKDTDTTRDGWEISIAEVYVKKGEPRRAAELVKQIEAENLKPTHYRMVRLANLYVLLGEKDAAFDALEKGYAARASWMFGLDYSRDFDAIRDDPRYKDLKRRIGLPE